MQKSVEFLMVEDNVDDIGNIQAWFREYKISNHVYIVPDGVEAVKFLSRHDNYNTMEIPDMIMVSSPILRREDGYMMLNHIKNDSSLRHIPLTALIHTEDERTELTELAINLCVAKPVNLTCFLQLIRQIDDFWLTIAAE